jgi:hypothetical protein
MEGSSAKEFMEAISRVVPGGLVNFLTYATDGSVPINNNYLESHIRPFVIGRNNWLFSQGTNGRRKS